MGPLEQVGPEWPPLSILPKVSGGNGGGEPRGSPKVRVEGLGYGGGGCGDFQPFHPHISGSCRYRYHQIIAILTNGRLTRQAIGSRITRILKEGTHHRHYNHHDHDHIRNNIYDFIINHQMRIK